MKFCLLEEKIVGFQQEAEAKEVERCLDCTASVAPKPRLRRQPAPGFGDPGLWGTHGLSLAWEPNRSQALDIALFKMILCKRNVNVTFRSQ